MLAIFNNVISNKTFLIVGAYLGAVVTILFFIMISRKRNRDERGWKILGKSSLVAFIYMMILVNVIAKITGNGYLYNLGYMEYANTIQWIYTTVIIVELIAVFVFRKIE